jgi:hypothetical protein
MEYTRISKGIAEDLPLAELNVSVLAEDLYRGWGNPN